MTEKMLEAERLEKSFRTEWGVRKPFLQDFSLSLERGELFALLGPNGSGKTTVTKTILGLMHKTGGTVLLRGKSNGSLDVKREVAYMPENPQFPPNESADSFLRFLAALQRMTHAVARTRIDEVLSLVSLQGERERKIKTYSKGMVKRLGLAQALVHNPKMAFFDEPLDGLDPCGVDMFLSCVQKMKKDGVTIMLTTHIVHALERVVDRVGFMQEGRMVRVMSADSVRSAGGFESVYRAVYRKKEND